MSDIEAMVWNTDVGAEPGQFPTYMTKYVAAAIARRAYKTGAVHFSQSAIAQMTGCSPRAIWSALRALEDAGMLRRQKRGEKGRRQSDRLVFVLRSVTISLEPDDGDDGLVDPKRFETKLARDASGDQSREVRGDLAPGARQRHENTKTSGAKAPSSSMSATKRNTAPDDWMPSDSHRAKVSAWEWPDGMLEEQAERFKEWEFREAKTDFDRAFHRWLRTHHERLKGPDGTAGNGASPGGGPKPREERIGAMHRGALAALDRFQRERGPSDPDDFPV